MMVKELGFRESKVIQFDGTNFEEIKKFIKEDCDKRIYRIDDYTDANGTKIKTISVEGGYTLFLYKGTYLVQCFNLYGYAYGFADYRDLKALEKDYVLLNDDGTTVMQTKMVKLENTEFMLKLLIKKNVNPATFKQYMEKFGENLDSFFKVWNSLARNKDEELTMVEFLLIRDRIKELEV